MSISKQQASAFCNWFNQNKDNPPTPLLTTLAKAPKTPDNIRKLLTMMCAHYTLSVEACGQTYYSQNWYPMLMRWNKILCERLQ